MLTRLGNAVREIGQVINDVASVVACLCFGWDSSRSRDRCCGVWKPEELPDFREPPLRALPPRHSGSPSSEPNSQPQCLLFLHLPVEIRLLIWELVLGRRHNDDCLHLDARDGILWYRQCWETNPRVLEHDRGPTRHVCWDSRLWSQYEGLQDREFMYPEPKKGRRLLNLLLSCKLIYAEAIDVLYQSNTFDFRRASSLARLPHVVLPHRFQQLRSLSMDIFFKYPIEVRRRTEPQQSWSLSPAFRMWDENQSHYWLEACDVLASLEQLQRLRITIATAPLRYRVVSEGSVVAVLEPLRGVRATNFTVLWVGLLEAAAKERLKTFSFAVTYRYPYYVE